MLFFIITVGNISTEGTWVPVAFTSTLEEHGYQWHLHQQWRKIWYQRHLHQHWRNIGKSGIYISTGEKFGTRGIYITTATTTVPVAFTPALQEQW
jgi:hypothetical protein